MALRNGSHASQQLSISESIVFVDGQQQDVESGSLGVEIPIYCENGIAPKNCHKFWVDLPLNFG
jgi:hypothetical protein